MYIVQLTFSNNKSLAAEYMQGHKDWIDSGFNDGVFILAGSIQPNLGGVLIAHNTTLSELQRRVEQDPFVSQDVVSAKILEISPSRTEKRLAFLAS